jgi:hypothetical protein
MRPTAPGWKRYSIEGETSSGPALLWCHEIEAESGLIQAGAGLAVPARGHSGGGRFGEANLLAARLAVDSGRGFGDPGSSDAVFP